MRERRERKREADLSRSSSSAMFENLYAFQGLFSAFLSLSHSFSLSKFKSSSSSFLPFPSVAITSNASQLPPLTEFLSDMSRGTPHDRFPVADESRWIVISPERAVRALGGQKVSESRRGDGQKNQDLTKNARGSDLYVSSPSRWIDTGCSLNWSDFLSERWTWISGFPP